VAVVGVSPLDGLLCADPAHLIRGEAREGHLGRTEVLVATRPQVEQVDAVPRVLDDRPQARLGLPQGGLGALAVRDVEDEGDRVAAVRLEQDEAHLGPDLAAVRAHDAFLVRLAAAEPACLLDGGGVERRVLWRRDLVPAHLARLHLRAAAPDEACQLLVAVVDAAVHVAVQHAEQPGLGEGTQLGGRAHGLIERARALEGDRAAAGHGRQHLAVLRRELALLEVRNAEGAERLRPGRERERRPRAVRPADDGRRPPRITAPCGDGRLHPDGRLPANRLRCRRVEGEREAPPALDERGRVAELVDDLHLPGIVVTGNDERPGVRAEDGQAALEDRPRHIGPGARP
jgi:hypothetical protein